ncbi:hypothetical protein KBD08_03335 [Candidatus Babeliales bacterium]|nr:hypothetical protein [Candidatus Babeliales bacterium]
MIYKLPQNIDRFYISDTEWIAIQTRDLPLNFVYSCYDLDIVFHTANNQFIFGASDAGSFCSTIQYTIPKLLNSQLILPSRLQNNLGISNNNYCMALTEDYTCLDYHFFGNSHIQQKPYFDSFLYNDEQGNIIFEITPQYPWNDKNEEDINHPDFISYSQFLKNYHPTIIRTIDPKYLHQWIEQTHILEPLFEKNEIEDLHQSEH